MAHDSSLLWSQKGETLSDKTARKEFNLNQDDIENAIRAGKLQYRRQSVFGSPFLRLLRKEVEKLVSEKDGSSFLESQKAKKELALINKNLKLLNKQVIELESKRENLLETLGKKAKSDSKKIRLKKTKLK